MWFWDRACLDVVDTGFLVGEDNLCLMFKKTYDLHKQGCGLFLLGTSSIISAHYVSNSCLYFDT